MVKRVHVRLAALWSHCGHGLDPLLMNRSGVENLAEFGRKFLTRSRDSWQERSGHKQVQDVWNGTEGGGWTFTVARG